MLTSSLGKEYIQRGQIVEFQCVSLIVSDGAYISVIIKNPKSNQIIGPVIYHRSRFDILKELGQVLYG